MKPSTQFSNLVLLVVGVMAIYLLYSLLNIGRVILTRPTASPVSASQPLEDPGIVNHCIGSPPLHTTTARSSLLHTTDGISTSYSGIPISATTIPSVRLIARWGAGADGKYLWGQGTSSIHDISLNRTNGIVALATDVGMEVRRLSNGLVVCHRKSNAPIEQIALRYDAELMVFKPRGTPVEVWNLTTNTQESMIKESRDVRSIEFQSKGNLVGMIRPDPAEETATFRIWDSKRGGEVWAMEIEEGSIFRFGTGTWDSFIAISEPDVTSVHAIGSSDSSISIEHGKPKGLVAFHPNGRHLLVVDSIGVQLWDLDRHTETWNIPQRTSLVRDVAISPQGEWFATIHRDGILRLWDMATGNLLQEHQGQNGEGTALEISPDNDFILTSNLDGTIAVWGIP
jgi:WD40 repeat protein